MEDSRIVELFWERSEHAIAEVSDKYGNYCSYIAFRILQNRQDSEECVNDTYWKAWESMPPKRPDRLAAFLGKITRNLSLNRYEQIHAQKRGGGQVVLALEELNECVPSGDFADRRIEDMELEECLNRFLGGLPAETRRIFLRRYWYFGTVQEIAAELGMTESRVKGILFRTRKKLKSCMEKEGISL